MFYSDYQFPPQTVMLLSRTYFHGGGMDVNPRGAFPSTTPLAVPGAPEVRLSNLACAVAGLKGESRVTFTPNGLIPRLSGWLSSSMNFF